MVSIGFDKRAFGSFLLIILFVGFTFGAVWGVKKFPSLRSKAAANNQPFGIGVANVTDGQVTIYWTTQDPTTGFVSFGESQELGRSHLDDRDTGSAQAKPYRNHSVTVTSLKPKTKYYYTIGVNDATFDRDGFPFTFFTTGLVKSAPHLIRTLDGRVITTTSLPASGYLVTLTFEKESGELSNTLAAITTPSGNFTINLSSLRLADGTAVFPLTDTVPVTITATMRDQTNTTASQTQAFTPNQPLPTFVFQAEGQTLPTPAVLTTPPGGSTNPQATASASPAAAKRPTFDLLFGATKSSPTPKTKPGLQLIF